LDLEAGLAIPNQGISEREGWILVANDRSESGMLIPTEETRVVVSTEADIIAARQMARELAADLGFASADLTLISTAISELARNIVRYAMHGEIILMPINGKNGCPGILIIARDEGPGIPDVSEAMQDGYSTSGSLGLGLPGVKRLMDEFEIKSEPGSGTTVTVKKWTH